jgi:hypothetical protein
MNVFENLIDELKEENLLEETVIESQKADRNEYLGEVKINSSLSEPDDLQIEGDESEKAARLSSSEIPKLPLADLLEVSPGNNSLDLSEELLIVGNSEFVDEAAFVQNFPAVETAERKEDFNEKEFYRKRAIEEVSGLQMVEHVLSGIEREQMKAAPKNYNDIAAKKALHDFLKIAADVKSPEHAQAEFQLMQETETWCSALSHRDKRISVAHLRRYCETTKPPLSSQALISLARFYRNLPLSEPVRSKFDFVVTKLFSKDDGSEKRVLVFSRDELIQHFKDLYAEWSSISLYSADDDDSAIVLAALKFEDFTGECAAAESFDELVKTDFFNRLRLFKESTEEVFFAPLVTAAAIECNTRIGNRYVDLIRAERLKNNTEDLQNKYGFMHDQAISDATSKTSQLVELLKEKNASVKKEQPKEPARANAGDSVKEKVESPAPQNGFFSAKKSPKNETERAAEKTRKTERKSLFTVNKWLLAATVIVILVNAALYAFVYFGDAPIPVATDIKKVNLENSSLKDFLKSARISGETFYGITLPSWDALTNAEKEETLKKIISFGADKGFARVHLLDKDGKTVGFASAEKVEVINP